jgi:hypothetical protein
MDTEPETTTTITLCKDLSAFFRENIVAIRERRHYSTSAEVETYLAALLADSANAQNSPFRSDKPLTLQLAEALNYVGSERFARLRQIGDGALYTTGLFGEYLARRGLELSYIERLGARAYATAGRMMVTDRSRDSSLLEELASHFHRFVDLLREVADMLRVRAARSSTALVDLYERWLYGGSDSLAAALASEGLVVPLRSVRGVQ